MLTPACPKDLIESKLWQLLAKIRFKCLKAIPKNHRQLLKLLLQGFSEVPRLKKKRWSIRA